MMELKYATQPFGKMKSQELVIAVMALMAKIEAITGWAIPDSPKDDILIDQFALKLTESYPTVNAEEMEFAFRSNASVKDWGKAMNLGLIDEVMIPYLEKRRELSAMEETVVPAQIEHKEDTSDQAMTEWYNETAKLVKEGRMKVSFIPLMLYEWAEKKELINPTKAEKYEYLEKAVMYRQAQLSEECESEPRAHGKLRDFMTMKDKGEFTGDEVDLLKNLAKRMILFDHFKKS
ncbi:MAG TPA: hypothetical protein VD996_02580 [Chitinophagaceae bacterium]|nr:hypothetical protein [Chitinophagaceae bacterium]